MIGIENNPGLQLDINKPWEPKPPKVTIEYDEKDLPFQLLYASARRDKHEANVIHWEPAASSRSVKEALSGFLAQFRTFLLGHGFTVVYLNNKAYHIETGEPVEVPTEEKKPAEEYETSFSESKAEELITTALSEFKFRDPQISFEVDHETKTTTTYPDTDTKNRFIVIKIRHADFGTKEVTKIKATYSDSGDYFYPDTHNYSFKIEKVVEKVRAFLADNPAYSLV